MLAWLKVTGAVAFKNNTCHFLGCCTFRARSCHCRLFSNTWEADRGSAGAVPGQRADGGKSAFRPASFLPLCFSPLCHIKSRGQAVERVPRRVDGESPKIGQAASRACTHAHGAQPQRLAMTLATRCADVMVVVVVGGWGGSSV